MCFSFITVQLLYMLFQLSQSMAVMWDFIFHLWKEERDTETVKAAEKIKTGLLAVVGSKTGSPTVVRNKLWWFHHWLILTIDKVNLKQQLCLSLN